MKILMCMILYFFSTPGHTAKMLHSRIYSDVLGFAYSFKNIGYEYTNYKKWGIGFRVTHRDRSEDDVLFLKLEYIYSLNNGIFEKGWFMAGGPVYIKDAVRSTFLKKNEEEFGVSVRGGYRFALYDRFDIKIAPEIINYDSGSTFLFGIEVGYKF
jgi:hypothetical protein